jgi:biopolymer transport protein ExbD
MSKFRKDGKKSMPAISTASLPDIVFMLLFFFMVTTVMRPTELKVKIKTPEASEVTKLKKKSLVSYIYIGTPNDKSKYGASQRIQLDDMVQAEDDVSQIISFINTQRAAMQQVDVPKMRVQIKADTKTKMRLVTDVKQELRKAQAYKINYSTVEKRN